MITHTLSELQIFALHYQMQTVSTCTSLHEKDTHWIVVVMYATLPFPSC